jgi:NAD(P)-dependent dehydrogenase (short-subunit alcohol dehydrogenase family)
MVDDPAARDSSQGIARLAGTAASGASRCAGSGAGMPEQDIHPLTGGAMTRDLPGRTALVTGVTSGIGRATAEHLLAAGLRVAGCARDAERLQVVAGELPGLVPLPADVRDRADRERVVADVVERWGRLDVLVNNAGVGFVGAVEDMTADDVERVFETNATAVVDLTRIALPHMLERGDGDVVMLSSSAIWATLPPLTVYASSKHAVDGFTEGLRREVAGRGVRVHSVNPGFVATEFLARAAGEHPDEGEAPTSPGSDPTSVARVVVEQVRSGSGRTVAVPRVMGLGRLLSVPGVSHAFDLVARAGSGPMAWLGERMRATHRVGSATD